MTPKAYSTAQTRTKQTNKKSNKQTKWDTKRKMAI